MMINRTTVTLWVFTATLAIVPATNMALSADAKDGKESGLHLVSGTLSKLDLSNGRGLLTTDLGRPIYFDVPKAYLFENVTVGAHIALRLDEYGRAIRVMDTSIPDLMGKPDTSKADQPLAASLQESVDQ